MTTLNRVVVEWAGAGVVGRAVTVLHYSASDNAAPPVAAIKSAFDGIAASLGAGVTVQVPNVGDVIEDTTGDLVGTWSTAPVGQTIGTASGGIAAGVGCCIGWTTGGIVQGKKGPRKLRGRTFIVPLGSNSYEGNGTLITPLVTNIQAFAAALMAAGPLAIWHRPNAALGLVGNSYGVQSYRVRDKVAFLSSRRD